VVYGMEKIQIVIHIKEVNALLLTMLLICGLIVVLTIAVDKVIEHRYKMNLLINPCAVCEELKLKSLQEHGYTNLSYGINIT